MVKINKLECVTSAREAEAPQFPAAGHARGTLGGGGKAKGPEGQLQQDQFLCSRREYLIIHVHFRQATKYCDSSVNPSQA